MVTLGSGKHQYETTGEDFGKLPDDWTYREATAVAVDSKDRVIVFNRGTHPIVVLDTDGNVLDAWGDGEFGNPHGVSIGPDDSIFTVDTVQHSVKQFSAEGKLLLSLKAEHPARELSGDPFCRPCHLAVDPRNGDLLVADGYSNARVHRYSPDGRHLTSFGESGTGPGQFNIVHNVIVDRQGWIYVADRENHRIQVFDPDGGYQAQWNNLSRSACICMREGDQPLFFVGEYFCGIESNLGGTNLGPRVSVISAEGEILARLSEETFGDEPRRFYAPHGIDVDSRGNIYVAEVGFSEYGKSMDPPRELRSLQQLVKKQT